MFEGSSVLGHAKRVLGGDKVKFSIIRFLETWPNDDNLSKHYFFQVEGYSLLHGNKKSGREERLAIFVHKSLCYIKQNDFCKNCEAM